MTGPSPEYIPRRHRDRSMAANPQSEITDMPGRDELPPEDRAELDRVINRIEASPQEQAPAPQQQPLLMSRGEAATIQANSVIDLVSAHTIEQINDLRKQLDELESLLFQDCAHVKAHIASHVVLNKITNQQTSDISETLKRLREERARLVGATVK